MTHAQSCSGSCTKLQWITMWKKEDKKMDIVEEIAKGLIVGVLMFCLISIADNLQTIKENTTPTCACEVLD